jgi:methyl-accepting chemotaxis protein
MLPDTTIGLVQRSWAQVLPIAPQAAELFYNNLFAADPSLRHLFRGDMKAQGMRLMGMISGAVGKLDQIEQLVPVLQDLGRRHMGYGVKPQHYDTVGAALLQTLEQGLGRPAFTPEVRAAWTAVYGLLAGTMMQACAELEAA